MNILRNTRDYRHRFVVHDPRPGVQLVDDLEIHVLELDRWRASRSDDGAVSQWVRFFAEGETWSEIPPDLRSAPMEEAMGVLEEFKENADWGQIYRNRRDAERRRATHEKTMAELVAKAEQAVAKAEQAVADKEQAVAKAEQAVAQASAENQRYRRRLREAGLDPDSEG